MPEISVVMAVYNGEKYIREALDSILEQTFTLFEAIIIDDASVDATPEILSEYAKKDSRIKVFTNESNLRLAKSLNRGIALARGKYILRMDADDICLKDRLEKQYEYMESHKDTDVSFCKYFAKKENEIIPCCVGRKCDFESVKAMFLFFCPVIHPGVIAKSEVMKKYGYDPAHTCSEDLDLWTRMIADGRKIECEDDYLMLYRLHSSQITANSRQKQKEEVLKSERKYFSAMNISIPDEEFYINGVYFREKFDESKMREFRAAVTGGGKIKNSAILNAFTEVLAEYRRGGERGILRLAGIKLAVLVFFWKIRNSKDRKKAQIAAANAGIEIKG